MLLCRFAAHESCANKFDPNNHIYHLQKCSPEQAFSSVSTVRLAFGIAESEFIYIQIRDINEALYETQQSVNQRKRSATKWYKWVCSAC